MTALAAAELERLLEESGALRSGHFQLSSGRHAARYVQCALLLELPSRARRVGEALAERLAPHRPEVVVSPALGGLIIGHETAAALGVPFRFVERKDGEMRLRRGFTVAPGERVAVVEDVVTTGGSAREAVAAVTALGAEVVAAGAVIDRSGGGGGRGARGAGPFDVPFEALLELALQSFEPAACPLCSAGKPIDKPGSRPA